MTDTTTPTTRTPLSAPGSSYVEWSAIFAGAVVASAIIVLMTAFGSAIGLSLVSPYHGPSPALFYVALALWFTWITVSSFIAGGYITGRMRRPIDGATQHEVHVRDGVHGLVVWALAVVIGTSLATFSLSSAVTTSSLSSAVKGAADPSKSGASATSPNAGLSLDQMGYEIDALFRNDAAVAPTRTAPTGKNASAAVGAAAASVATLETPREEVSRILAMTAANGAMSKDDRAYLAHVVTSRAGLSQADAEKRLDTLSEQMKTSADKMRAATEVARKSGILLAFLATASMVLGAAAAWWGAGVGGRHRDEQFDASHLTRW
jgi:hypothetical protein